MNHLKTCKPHLTVEEYIAIIETDELGERFSVYRVFPHLSCK